ncbi:putative inner membrane translocase TIM44 [Besnoitia besnoiti]|uniref:Putative inner membrane translocase TIM44 n=1 Tax=Besnoitia besnoiti TaxID=94643 RepID=A0A2A9MAL2_BESBE|nr:putative inner membrane translocase TIM44 [Besnoitia besnoiti]PFH35025.1 putative inner membrane translocase TIM44 [Besnoitia besnoiti]
MASRAWGVAAAAASSRSLARPVRKAWVSLSASSAASHRLVACSPLSPASACASAPSACASSVLSRGGFAAFSSASDGGKADSGRHSSSYRSSHSRSSHQRRGASVSGSSSSFIKSVLAQVKEDMEKNKELQKAMEDLRASSLSQKSEKLSTRVQEAASAASALASQVASQTQSLLGDASEKATRVNQLLKDKAFTPVQKATEENATLRGIAQIVGKAGEGLKGAFSKVASAAEIFRDDVDDAEKKAAKWRQDMAVQRYKEQEERKKREQEQMERKEKGEAEPTEADAEKKKGGDEQTASSHEEPREDALILSQRTSWDRFSSRFKDMSFLQNFFENPLMAQLFGETEVAASIREMKIIDPKFKLGELHNLMERVIAAHIVQAFLLGDEETLAIHCAEGAFAALRASIVERRAQRVRLDSEILHLGNVELVGARRSLTPPVCASQKISEDECPWFVYTFACQQLNCLRSEVDGKIVEGRADDIRRVLYSVAIAKHPRPETEGLLYPWMIREIAIIGSEAVW